MGILLELVRPLLDLKIAIKKQGHFIVKNERNLVKRATNFDENGHSGLIWVKFQIRK